MVAFKMFFFKLSVPPKVPFVVLAGGAFKACPCLADLLHGCLGLERAELRPLAVEPAQGAVSLALEQLE